MNKTARYKIITDSGGSRYRFFCDLHTDIGWTKKYVKNQIKITEKEISTLKRKEADYLDVFYKECYLDAYIKLLEYMEENPV